MWHENNGREGISPGNLRGTALRGELDLSMVVDWMRSTRRATWVLFPDLSSPSMTMNAPRAGGDMGDQVGLRLKMSVRTCCGRGEAVNLQMNSKNTVLALEYVNIVA